MKIAPLVERLENNAPVLGALLSSVTDEQAGWRPGQGVWSMLDVACHLLDEEREDFPARLRLLLESPGSTWPPIDPVGWVEARGYADQVLAVVVESFLAERRRSVEWLRSLRRPDWDRAYEHPSLGALRAGDLLIAWTTHDTLHLRQLAGLDRAWACRHAEPYRPHYAGDW